MAVPGETKNSAPANIAERAVAPSTTVPAQTSTYLVSHPVRNGLHNTQRSGDGECDLGDGNTTFQERYGNPNQLVTILLYGEWLRFFSFLQ